MNKQLYDVLVWLMGGGSIVVVAWLSEQSEWFQAQSAKAKPWIQFGFASLIAVLAYLVVTYVPATTLDVIAPYFGLIFASFSYYFINQVAHKYDPDRG